LNKDLAVGMCFYNPFKFEIMNENIIRTCEHLLESWKDIYVVELIYNDPELNQESIKDKLPKGVEVLQVRCDSLMWHKEQLLNILAKHVINNEGYDNFAAFDADILFENPDWPQRILAKLETYQIVQCYNKGKSGWHPNEDPQSVKPSFLCRWFHDQKTNWSFPGGAWSARKKFWTECGFFEYNIAGGGDTVFASALLYPACGFDDWERKYKKTDVFFESNSYETSYETYRHNLNTTMRTWYGYVNQTALYQVHGARTKRAYVNRQQILQSINLIKDINRNKHNLTEWVNPNNVRAKLLSNYFKARNDDNPNINATTGAIVPCTCLITCQLNSLLYEKDKVYEIALADANEKFKIEWGQI